MTTTKIKTRARVYFNARALVTAEGSTIKLIAHDELEDTRLDLYLCIDDARDIAAAIVFAADALEREGSAACPDCGHALFDHRDGVITCGKCGHGTGQ